MRLCIGDKGVRTDTGLVKRLPELSAEHIVADLADEGAFPAELCEHGEDIAGCAAGICLKERVPLGGVPAQCEVDQQFA